MASKLITSIDIGFSSVKVAQFELVDGAPRLVTAGIAPCARSEAGAASREQVVQALRQVLDEQKIRAKSAYLSLPRSQITQKRLSDFPNNASVQQVADIVSIRAETELPFGGSPVVYDYHIVQHDPGQVLVDLVGARQAVVSEYLEILEVLDIAVEAVAPSTSTLGFLGGYTLEQMGQSNGQTNRAPLLLLNIGAGRTDLVLLRGLRPVFSRSFPVAGDRLTQALAATDGRSFEEAEAAKLQPMGLTETPDPMDPVARWAANLAREIELSIQAAAHETIGDLAMHPDRIWLSGGGAQLSGLSVFLSQRLAASFEVVPQVEVWNPVEPLGGQAAGSPALSLVTGLGLQAAMGSIRFNLTPMNVKQKREHERQQHRVLVYAAASAVVLLALIFGVGSWVSTRVSIRNEVTDELMRTQSQYTAVESQLQKDLVLTEMIEPRVSPLDVLLELSEKLPPRKEIAFKTFTLTNLSPTGKGTLVVAVEANSHADISQALNVLRNSPLFASVRSGQVSSAEKDKRPIFQAQFNCTLAENVSDWVVGRQHAASQQDLQVASLPPLQQALQQEEPAPGDDSMMMDGGFVPLLLDDEPMEESTDSPAEVAPNAPGDTSPPGVSSDLPEEGAVVEPEIGDAAPTVPAEHAGVHRIGDSAVSEIEVETEDGP